ncbi:MAG: hypothetical protein M1834_005551 [Cirrosporium novae-zelandiae]|nr:MAG: hypothetical protein M1834_005551 [Cirrosporium novae-zelandiae]
MNEVAAAAYWNKETRPDRNPNAASLAFRYPNGHLYDGATDDDWEQWMQWDANADFSSPDLELNNPFGCVDGVGPLRKKRRLGPCTPPNERDMMLLSSSIMHSMDRTPQARERGKDQRLPDGYFSTGPSSISTNPQDSIRCDPICTPSSERSSVPGRRKSSLDEQYPISPVSADNSKRQPANKRPHNIIERRYRTNLNEKIAMLRNSVPSLRTARRPKNTSPPSSQDGQDGDDDTIDDNSAMSKKLNKGVILTKATEYIQDLERRNRFLEDEIKSLTKRLSRLEGLAEQGGIDISATFAKTTEGKPAEKDGTEIKDEDKSSTVGPPQGMLKLPEAMQKLRDASLQVTNAQGPQIHMYDPSAQPVKSASSSTGSNGSFAPGKFVSRLMIGSIAGLMVLEGFGDRFSEEERPGVKELFSLPLELLPHASTLSTAFQRLHHSIQRYPFQLPGYNDFVFGPTSILKCFTILMALAFIMFLYLFNSSPEHSKDGFFVEELPAVPPPASPIEVRRSAWQTAVQTVWVPRHTLILEFLAFWLESIKYLVRLFLGWPLYAWITSRSEDEEMARIKAWDVAIDAQLAGGDPEIKRSRIVLTLWASGSLPRTPARLMLKALHIRILFWGVARSGTFTSRILEWIAKKMAAFQWSLALKLQTMLMIMGIEPSDDTDALQEHLAHLVRLDCNEVMTDDMIERASNLAWNRSVREASASNDFEDSVSEDFAIRSPLDAIAAWTSARFLHIGLIQALDNYQGQEKAIRQRLNMALNIAPPASVVQTQSLAARSLFFDHGRDKSIGAVLSALPPFVSSAALDIPPQSPGAFGNPLPLSACTSIRVAARCAMGLEMLKNSYADTVTVPEVLEYCPRQQDSFDMGLLGFVAAIRLLQRVYSDNRIPDESRQDLAQIAIQLQIWSRNEKTAPKGLNLSMIEQVNSQCATLAKMSLQRRNSGEQDDVEERNANDTIVNEVRSCN